MKSILIILLFVYVCFCIFKVTENYFSKLLRKLCKNNHDENKADDIT